MNSAEPVAETYVIQAREVAGSKNILTTLANAARSAGLIEARAMAEQMRGGGLITVEATSPGRQPTQVHPLTWVEKPGLCWAFSGWEGGDALTVSHLNGPALKALLREWLAELLAHIRAQAQKKPMGVSSAQSA